MTQRKIPTFRTGAAVVLATADGAQLSEARTKTGTRSEAPYAATRGRKPVSVRLG